MLILYRISDTQSNWSLYQPSDKWEITYLTRRSHIAHAILTGYEARDGARTNEQFCTAARDAMIRTKERREIKFSRPAHADLCSGKLIKSHTRNSDAYEWYCLTRQSTPPCHFPRFVSWMCLSYCAKHRIT